MGDVSISDKKDFIQWFLNRYELRKRESAWLLSYLSSDDELLKRVHFVENLRNLPKTIMMSTRCIRMTSFKFTKHNRVSTDVETAFYDIVPVPMKTSISACTSRTVQLVRNTPQYWR